MSRPDSRNGKLKWHKRWLESAITATHLLSCTAHGAYDRIVLEILRKQAPIPDEDTLLCKITGLTPRKLGKVRAELVRHSPLHFENGLISDPDALQSIEEFRSASDRNRNNVGQRYKSYVGKIVDAPS